MDLRNHGHLLAVPGADGQLSLMHLETNGFFPETGFVLVPYQNPASATVRPRYFKITATNKIGIPEQEMQEIPPLDFKPAISRSEYIKTVKKLKEEIQLGNIYEINFCQEFVALQADIDPIAVFLNLCRISKAPYSYFLKTGDDVIICASPELFLKKDGDRLISKPIKGTMKRGGTTDEDLALKTELFHSFKDRTENVMAVDVARNDLSRLAQKGSVSVNKLYNIESFETVHQMVSTVSCMLKPDQNFDTILDCTFPMASMTGAPKIRAMQLIDRHEKFRRNFYSGCMGFSMGGDFELCVIIRSIFYNLHTKRLSFAVGGAITYLSDPEKEYEECMVKARTVLKALNGKITA